MTASGTTSVMGTTDGPVHIIRLDDGKANVVRHEVIEAIHAELDRIEDDPAIHAVVIAGRDGQFSGGFDLKEFAKGPEATRDLVIAGGALCNRLFVFPKVTITAVTGNAIAAGAILTMACDWNVGAAGAFKMGLPETAIGMALPIFAFELARVRLLPPYFTRGTILGELFDPATSLAAGYLDQVTPADETVDAAIARAHELAALTIPAVALTKRAVRGAVHELIGASLVDNVTSMTTGLSSGSGS